MRDLTEGKAFSFSLHSIAVKISGEGVEGLARDFEFYKKSSGPIAKERFTVSLDCLARPPSLSDLPDLPSERVFSDCVLFREGGLYYYEYPGAVLRVKREGRSSVATLISDDKALCRELAYLYLQTEVGRFLDAQGLHRVHALGVGLPSGKGALILLPSGGGKSTMAMELVRRGGCILLSDDSPLVDRRGNVHPFPMRLSFRPEAEVPSSWRERAEVFERRRHGAKTLVPVSVLPPASIPSPNAVFEPGFLVVGQRHGRRSTPTLERFPSYRGALLLGRDLVVGLGLAQVLEHVLSDGWGSLSRMAPIAASRFRAAASFSARASSYRLNMSRDPRADASLLLKELTGSS